MIRKADIDDTEIIAEYNCKMARETEDIELERETVYQGVKNAISDNKSRYYLYEREGLVVGQMMITREWSDWRNGFFWWIQSVYVHVNYRNRGIFKSLYQHIEKLAAANDEVCGLRLYVEKDNDIARQIYNKLGMNETDYLLYEELL